MKSSGRREDELRDYSNWMRGSRDDTRKEYCLEQSVKNTPKDMLAPEALIEPEYYFGRLREDDPIHWNEQRKMWIVTRYEDVIWICRQPHLFSSDKLGFNVKELPEEKRDLYRERYSAIYSAYPHWLSAVDKFTNPLETNIGRRPNAHLGFGQGIHICLGAPLARLEAQETYLALTQRFPNMRLATDKFEWHAILRGRALKALPVTLR